MTVFRVPRGVLCKKGPRKRVSEHFLQNPCPHRLFFFNKFSKITDRFEKCYATDPETSDLIHIWLNGPLRPTDTTHTSQQTQHNKASLETANTSELKNAQKQRLSSKTEFYEYMTVLE